MLFKHPNVIGIRDLESIQVLANRIQTLSKAKVVVIGNGGIALELIHLVRLYSHIIHNLIILLMSS